MKSHHYLPDWKPQQDIIIRFDDKTAEPRTNSQINKMVEEMRDVAGKFGFDLNQIGLDKGFEAFYKMRAEYEEREKYKYAIFLGNGGHKE